MSRLPTEAELDITTLTGVFVSGGNPAAAWAAYHLARRNGLPIPESVAAEIDRFAAILAAPALAAWNGNDQAQITAKSVTDAWGIERGKNPTRDLRLVRRNADIFVEYWEHIRSGKNDCDAVDEVMEKFALSDKAIREILTASRKEVGTDDPLYYNG